MQETQTPATSAPQAPTAPAAPAAPGTQAVVGRNGTVTIAGTANPAELYQALRAQRRVLLDQLERLEDERQGLTGRLSDDATVTSPVSRTGIEQRITAVDQRIGEVNQQLAASEREIARVAGIPGAAVQPPDPPNPNGDDETVAIIGVTFTMLVLFPLALAQARRIWRRSAKGVAALPGELMERFTRLEQSVDSVAIEVERISEGQRFVTRLMSEGRASAPLGAGSAQPEPAYRSRTE